MRDERIAEEGFRNRYATAKARAEAELHSKAKSMARAGVGGGFAALAAAIVMSREVARDQRKIHEQLAGLSTSFRQHLHNEVDKELKFVVDVGGKSLEIRARSLEELRFKMKRLYEKTVAVKVLDR